MRFGEWGARLSAGQVADLLAAALDVGIDTLDLADIYGDHSTNALIGDALRVRPALRSRITLVAKAGIVMPHSPGNTRGVQYYNLSPTHLQRALDHTLRDLGVEHVHTVMLHRFDPHLDPNALADWVHREQARGRMGQFAVSNFDAHALALLDGRVTVVANQIELSLTHSTALEDGSHAATRARHAEVQAWSPLGGGALLQQNSEELDRALQAMAHEFGIDRASLLLRWVASLPNTRVVLGSTRIERLAKAVRACEEPLPRDAWYALWQVARGHSAA